MDRYTARRIERAWVLVGMVVSLCAGLPARAGASRREADAALDRLATEATLARQAAAARADVLCEAAKRAYEALEYSQALDLLNRALEADPQHDGTRELAKKVRSLLGQRRDWASAGLEKLSREKQVQITEGFMELQRAINEGTALRLKSMKPGDPNERTDRALSRQIADLDRAIEQFKRVLEIIRWMPYQVDLRGEQQHVTGLLQECYAQRSALQEDLRVFKRTEAKQRAAASKSAEQSYLADRINQLLAMAQVQFGRGRFTECEDICERVMKVDPLNTEARALLHAVKEERHTYNEAELYDRTQHEWKSTMLNVEEVAMPHAETIRYPDNWEQILRRVENAGRIVDSGEEPEWAADIRRKLERKVSFEFVDTPLKEAVAFLQSLTNVNIIIDHRTEASHGGNLVNLKVSSMTMATALDWILKLADLDYALRDSAILIAERRHLQGDVLLRIYDVRDLTFDIPDFPAPDMQLRAGGQNQGGGVPGIVFVDDLMAEDVTTKSLAEMIQERVRPGEWAAELGTSIEERGGKLIVMQRESVHHLITRLLEDLRSTQQLLVNVEARFLDIHEGFFEEIGLDWGRSGGSGSGVLSNSFINELHSVSPGVIQSDTLTGTDTVGHAAGQVAAGIVPSARDVDIFGNGTLHVLGAVANYRPNVSPEGTLIGQTYGQMDSPLEGGLNMQLHHLGDVELLGFLHALKVRQAGSVLSAPRITVYNTQRAHMLVATQQSYVADYDITGEQWDPVIRQFLTGVVLDVRPIVSSDRRYVTLEVRASISELIDLLDVSMQGILPLPDGGGGSPTEPDVGGYPMQFPQLGIRRVYTTATIPDGGIILLGGMMKNIKFRAETGVPFLSNIPIVGKLFRWDVVDQERRNLSILVTSRIVSFEEEEKRTR